MVISPLFLQFLLESLQSGTSEECYLWAGVLSITAFVQIIARHALFFISMRCGWIWKNSGTALIHEKLLSMDATLLQQSGVSAGVMVNMISNDVARFEEFAAVRINP